MQERSEYVGRRFASASVHQWCPLGPKVVKCMCACVCVSVVLLFRMNACCSVLKTYAVLVLALLTLDISPPWACASAIARSFASFSIVQTTTWCCMRARVCGCVDSPLWW